MEITKFDMRSDLLYRPRIPIGLVPGGSGCALNCSLLIMNKQKLNGLNSLGSAASARNVAVGAAKGRSTKLDLVII